MGVSGRRLLGRRGRRSDQGPRRNSAEPVSLLQRSAQVLAGATKADLQKTDPAIGERILGSLNAGRRIGTRRALASEAAAVQGKNADIELCSCLLACREPRRRKISMASRTVQAEGIMACPTRGLRATFVSTSPG